MAINVKFLKGTAAAYAALTKDANTFYYTDDNNLYLGEIKLSNGADLANAVSRIAANEADIVELEGKLNALVGSESGSISDMITSAVNAAKTELEGRITTVDGKADKNATDIAALQTTVGDNKTATDAAIEALTKTVNDNETDIEAKVSALDERVTANATAASNAQTAANNAQADVDALEGKVGEVEEGKTIVQMIADAKTAATYDDTQIKADIQANADAIQAHKDEIDGVVTTLVGEDTGKSVRKIANEELAAQLLSGDAEADFKTLQELAAWLEGHPEDVAAMNLAIGNNTSAIEALEGVVGTLPEGETDVVAYVAKLVAAEETRAKAAEQANADAIAAEKTRAEGIEGGLETRLQAVEGKFAGEESVDAKIAAAKAEAIADAEAKDATVLTTAQGYANTAEQNAKNYADSLADNYATAEQGAKADTAVQSVVTGTANGTIAVDGTDVAVKGLGSAAYTEANAYDAAGSAAAVETKLVEALTWGQF